MTAVGVVERLGAELDRVLDPLVPRGSRCALLDFPTYHNPGDAAIWLGAEAWLRRRGADVVYRADLRSFDGAALRRQVRDGIVLLNGGGNFGDLYPAHQRFRELVLRGAPDNPVIQLPQSVDFTDSRGAQRAKATIEQHAGLTLLVRDHGSLATAKALFDTDVLLCPDMAFSLGRLEVAARAETDVLWLLRDDREAVDGRPRPVAGLVRDWQGATPGSGRWRAPLWAATRAGARLLGSALRGLPPGRPDRLTGLLFGRIADEQLDHAVRVLSLGRILVTDRMHGHILGCLLGLPQVLLDSVTGKVGRYHETWTADIACVRRATSVAHALELAHRLAGASQVARGDGAGRW